MNQFEIVIKYGNKLLWHGNVESTLPPIAIAKAYDEAVIASNGRLLTGDLLTITCRKT